MRLLKSVLSQNLRTDCDLALYLTMFEPPELKQMNLPEAIKARPSVDSLQKAGIEQENLIYAILAKGLGARCIHDPRKTAEATWADQTMTTALAAIRDTPCVILQPKMELGGREADIYRRMGVASAHMPIMPTLAGLVPDILIASRPAKGTYVIGPDAGRSPVAEGDARLGLTVIDVKHARDANPSYNAEVVFYAVMLANWLVDHGYADRFFVNAETYLWTRSGHLRRLVEKTVEDAAGPDSIFKAIFAELEPINTSIYLQTVRRFVTQKVPEIIISGNANWRDLDWGVGPRCGSCDWLAYAPYLNDLQREKVAKASNQHCYLRSKAEDHLSRIPLLTRGARRTLSPTFGTVEEVAVTDGDEAPYKLHSRLHADRKGIPAHAKAIRDNTTSLDDVRHDGLLAAYADLNVYVAVSFDVGAGLLAGVALLADFQQNTDFGAVRTDDGKLTKSWHSVTTEKTVEAERATILGFLHTLAQVFDHAHDTAPLKGGRNAKKTGTQIVFWSERQFEELCLAVGRHLSAILYDRKQLRAIKALAWLFPPEELQEQDNRDYASPVIAFAQQTLKRLVRTPAEYALTLNRVAEHYRTVSDAFQWRAPDSYYAEPFSDAIPRERIYEIWALSGPGVDKHLFWGGSLKTETDLTEGFARALRRQASDLRSISWRLRKDFKKRLRARADTLDLSIPSWASGVAQDSKLFIAWAAFENAFARSKGFMQFFKDTAETEAAHEGIRLVRHVLDRPDGSMEYEISESSVNTKLRAPNEYLCLAIDSIPGFPTLRVREVLPHGSFDGQYRNFRMATIFRVALLDLDRTKRTAVISFNTYLDDGRALLARIRTKLDLDLSGDIMVVAGINSDKKIERLRAILRAVGNPPSASTAVQTLPALGTSVRQAKGTSPETPLGRILWGAKALSQKRVRPDDVGLAIAAYETHLNSSQRNAVVRASTMALTVMWGPPGTGKTATCAALIAGLNHRIHKDDPAAPFRVLLTGPNYKAVSELVVRVLGRMRVHPTPSEVFLIASDARREDLKIPSKLAAGQIGHEITADRTDPGFLLLQGHLATATGIVIVATVTHQCPRISEELAATQNDSGMLRRLFDFVLIDESSQVDMSTAVGPLALLKEGGQLVVAGDRLQMPPVFQVEPPAGAEHLVGSIQTYLVERFGIATVDLLQNYRSHTDIVDYIKCLGYPLGLMAEHPATRVSWLRPIADCVAEAEKKTLIRSDAWVDLLAPDRCITALTYIDGMAGHANAFEAECVAVLARAMFEGTSRMLEDHGDKGEPGPWTPEEFWDKGVGIVTPHRAQKAQVMSALRRIFPDIDAALMDGVVDTVERFQGGQRHTIIISFGVGDPDIIAGEERFLLQLERTNVAVSRSMAKCIVLMSEEMAAYVPADPKAAAGAHALKGIVDEWCNRRRETTVTEAGTKNRKAWVRWREA